MASGCGDGDVRRRLEDGDARLEVRMMMVASANGPADSASPQIRNQGSRVRHPGSLLIFISP